MEQLQHQYHVEDVGRILLETQQELRLLREKMGPSGSGATTDIPAIQNILQRAEQDLRAKAEIVLNGLVNNTMQSNMALPIVPQSTPTYMKQHNERTESEDLSIEAIREHFGAIPAVKANTIDLGRDQERITKKKGRIMKKKTTYNRRLLPSVSKQQPGVVVPELTADDAKSGLCNLLNRGFIPNGVDLTPALTSGSGVIRNSAARIYDRSSQTSTSKPVPFTNPSSFNLASLKFDLDKRSKPVEPASQTQGTLTSDSNKDVASSPHPGRAPAKKQPGAARGNAAKAVVNLTLFPHDPEHSAAEKADQEEEKQAIEDNNSTEELRKNVEKIRGYNELLDTYSLHQFIIHKGKTLRETPEFVSFQRVADEIWGQVEEVIRELEALLTQYFVPLAYVDGQRLMVVSTMDKDSIRTRELLSCIVNEDQVASLLRRPGQRYKGKDKKRRAAITIQACARMSICRKQFMRARRQREAALLIQKVWRAFSSHQDLKRKLGQLREAQHAAWEARMNSYRSRWNSIKTSRRIVIHVPSLSVDEKLRLDCENLGVRQNLQLSRVCGAADPLVEIIYVSPFELNTEISQYYIKLLQLGGIAEPQTRVKIVHPENSGRFPPHLSLASLLLYSPHCLRRIKRMIKGKEAYLVTGIPGAEDKRLAVALQVPLLGIDPQSSLPLLTRTGAKKIFAKADVIVPVGASEIYDEHQLLFALAKLILANSEQIFWLIKLDYDPTCTGIALLDLSNLPFVRDIRKDKRTSDAWKQATTRESLLRLIVSELEKNLQSHVRMVFPQIYPTWNSFADALARFGAILEALPSTVLGFVRSNLFLEPSGEIHIASTQNHIGANSNRLKTIGYSFPQTLVPHEAIRGASYAIAKALLQHGLMGYVSVDFVTFAEDRSRAQRLWALSLHPFLTDSAASFAPFHLLCRGTLQPSTSKYLLADSCERTYVVLDYLYHPSLCTMQYSSFFHACRLHGVCFDVERSLGTAFLLCDSLTAGVLSILSLSESHVGSLSYVRTCLEVIAREVGTGSLHELTERDHESSNASGNFADILTAIRVLCEHEKTLRQRT